MAIVKLNLSGHDNQQLADMGFVTHKLHVNLADADVAQKVAAFLAPMIGSGDTVHVAMPGLGALVAITTTSIHALCGSFPYMVTMIRNPDDGTFNPGPTIDLQSFRNDVVRANLRDGVTIL